MSSTCQSGSVILVIDAHGETHEETSFTVNGTTFTFGIAPKTSISPFCNISFVYIRNQPHVSINYSVSIIDQNKVKLYTTEYSWTFDTHRSHVTDFLSHQDLLEYDQSGTITLQCELEVLPEKAKKKSASSNLAELSTDFQSLFISQKNADVVLVVSGKELPAHKLILCTRSPVFAAMFEHDTKENQEGRLVITDLEADVCEQMLHYIYTGSVQDLKQYAGELLVASDKYHLEALKSICKQHLFSSIDLDNACDVLLLADLHSLAQVKVKCIDYITNNATDVMITNGWKRLATKANLVVELFAYLAKKK